jgi:protein-L-isoaspartate O-methyltransferase
MVAENVFKKGKAWKNKYDKIIITAGVEKGKEDKIKHLAESLLKKSGVLICPYTEGPMMMFKKEDKKLIESSTKESYVFVPLLEKGVEKD